VFAVVGDPVAHSRSPELHNRWFADERVDAVYVALRAARSDGLVARLDGLGIAGANITVPHKIAVMEQLDHVEPIARAIGAVNTIWRSEKGWAGTNTDASGWALSVSLDQLAPAGAVVLGAGGAARAVVAALAERGIPTTVVNRTRARAQQLVDALSVSFPSARLQAAEASKAPRAPLWVNTTTLAPHNALEWVGHDRVLEGGLWSDLNYWADATPAREQLARTAVKFADGYGMLVYQAALAFCRFSGLPVDPDVLAARVM